MNKWISYFLSGATSIIKYGGAIVAGFLYITFSIAAILIILVKIGSGKLIVDGQFNAIPEAIIIAICFIVTSVMIGYNSNRY